MTGHDRVVGVGVILVSTVAESLGQLSFKRAADRRPLTAAGVPAGPIVAAFVNWRWLLLGYVGFVADGLLWSAALKRLDVTVAHPIGSLVFVVTLIASRLILGERVSRRRWAGVGLIVAGSALVAVG